MNSQENRKKIAIRKVLSQNNMKDTLNIFEEESEALKDCRFMFFSNDIGYELPDYIQNKKIEKCLLHSLIAKRKMLVLDNITFKEMKLNGKSDYYIDICVALDTQTVSYLRNIFTKNPNKIPEDKKEFIDYLIKNNINYDYSLYVIENANKINLQKIETFENILACERFKCLDIEKYLKSGVISYTKTENELLLCADEIFSIMNKINNDENLKNTLLMKCDSIRCILLKCIWIEFQYSKKGIKYKMKQLADFINNEIGHLGEREIALCYLYFSHDKRIQRFFKDIQKNNGDKILDKILGMAWDLTHLRHLEYLMANMKPLNSRYELYSLITFDYGLQEVIETFPIEKCVLNDGAFIPVYETPLFQLVKEINLQEIFEENKKIRYETFNSVKYNYSTLIKRLEKELLDII